MREFIQTQGLRIPARVEIDFTPPFKRIPMIKGLEEVPLTLTLTLTLTPTPTLTLTLTLTLKLTLTLTLTLIRSSRRWSSP